MASRDDDLARWAAYALVAHGEVTYVEQAFSQSNSRQKPKGQSIQFAPARQAAISALSNAAAEAGLPQPDPAGGILHWWHLNRAQLTLEPLPFVWPPSAHILVRETG